jgi:hypothetical protein
MPASSSRSLIARYRCGKACQTLAELARVGEVLKCRDLSSPLVLTILPRCRRRGAAASSLNERPTAYASPRSLAERLGV